MGPVTADLPIGPAAALLRTTARMLRYREALGLLAPSRPRRGRHRRYGTDQLRAAGLAIRLEQRYDVSPKALAFALRVLAEPQVQAEVRELGRLCGRLGAPPLAALDFEQQKALRLLRARR